MREKIEYFLVLLLIKISKIIPKNYVYLFLDKFSVFLFYILKSRRKLAINNLSLAFKDLSEDEVFSLAKQSFKSLARTTADCLLLLNKRIELEEFFENPEVYKKDIQNVMQDRENGILFFTAHFGNWEILTKFVAKIGFPQLVVSREGNNSLIENNITIPFRDEYNNELVYKDSAMSKIVKTLKNGGIVGILTDLKLNNSIYVPFFGRKCYTAKTVASLYLKYHPKIIPIFAKRLPNNKYEIIIREFPTLNLSINKQKDIETITLACNKIYENVITEDPKQWFWMHNRWKQD